MLKSMMHPETREPFLAYYTPNDDALKQIRTKRKREEEFGREEEEEEEEYAYRHVRDYTVMTNNDATIRQIAVKVDNVHHGVFYKPIDARINARRRLVRVRQQTIDWRFFFFCLMLTPVSQVNKDERVPEADDWERPTRLNLTRRAFNQEDRRRRRKVLRDDLGIEENGGARSGRSESPEADGNGEPEEMDDMETPGGSSGNETKD